MNTPLSMKFKVHFKQSGPGGRKVLHEGESPLSKIRDGRLPRVAKLMALAIRFDQLLRDGLARDLADLARLGQVTRARMTQIMNLLNLAPDIQEAILHLPPVTEGRDGVILRDLQPVCQKLSWREQRKMWERLVRR